MCTRELSLSEQYACACRAKRGREALEQVKAIAPGLPDDWEEKEAWKKVSVAVTEKPVKCGTCKSWWIGAIRESRSEPRPS